MPTPQPYKDDYYLWKYIPSLPAAIVFASLFVAITAVHAWKMLQRKMWFCVPFVAGGIRTLSPFRLPLFSGSANISTCPPPFLAVEVLGYISRAIAYNATGSLVPYLLQAIFLLLPPILFAASLYMVYSRIVRAVQGDSFSLLPPHLTTRFFVLCDVTFLSIQGNGAGKLTKKETQHTGNVIIITGLVLQIASFVFFVACCWVFHARFRRHLGKTHALVTVPWQPLLVMLYVTSVLITVRNVYRVVEYGEGSDGYLQSVEWPTYVLDAALMLLVMILYFIWYPDRLLPKDRDSLVPLTEFETTE